MVFKAFKQIFITLYSYYLILLNFLLILKMLSETLLRIPFPSLNCRFRVFEEGYWKDFQK
jgi:hypothetical protein